MENINHWCSVCGKGYHTCDSCRNTQSFTPWRSITDTIEHYKIHLIITDYQNGYMSKEEANKKLANICFQISELKEGVQKVINEIKFE